MSFLRRVLKSVSAEWAGAFRQDKAQAVDSGCVVKNPARVAQLDLDLRAARCRSIAAFPS